MWQIAKSCVLGVGNDV